MTISLSIQLESGPIEESLSDLQKRRTPRFRQQLTTRVLEQIVERVAARHPVETGRARAAWIDAVSQIRNGMGGNSKDARADQTDEADRTTAEVTNEVDYVVFLENGTRRMQPRHMVGRAMAEASAIVAQSSMELFRELVQS